MQSDSNKSKKFPCKTPNTGAPQGGLNKCSLIVPRRDVILHARLPIHVQRQIHAPIHNLVLFRIFVGLLCCRLVMHVLPLRLRLLLDRFLDLFLHFFLCLLRRPCCLRRLLHTLLCGCPIQERLAIFRNISQGQASSKGISVSAQLTHNGIVGGGGVEVGVRVLQRIHRVGRDLRAVCVHLSHAVVVALCLGVQLLRCIVRLLGSVLQGERQPFVPVGHRC
mmetsp:Transcript_19761/g.50187  ORF Transcript_19761/g.50187 Transcript_19761/m.50187 type:complete len:221 (+) Transcript_19761:104-766(+)